jgi:hypothetical protein
LQKNNTRQSLFLVLLLLFFIAGLVRLFILRFDAGDIYPAYSSLRSDPLGTKALYESLENFDTIAIRRNYQLQHALEFEYDTTFFYLGVSATGGDPVSEELIEVFDRLTEAGGRLVLSFLPTYQKNEKKTAEADARKKSNPKNRNEKPAPQKEPGKKHLGAIKKHWGVGLAFFENIAIEKDEYPALDAVSNRENLPLAVSWHTNLYFDLHDPAWQVLYSFEGRPVIVERQFAKGTIVLCADSYFISNEGLWSERHPKLLIWLMGGNSRLIFDETHFGIYRRRGVAALLRHYRLQWFFAALALPALLFLWKSTASFVPHPKENLSDNTEMIAEKDAMEGLIALLRRYIRRREILQICEHEWEQAFKKNTRIRPATFERVNRMVQTQSPSAAKIKDPVKRYRTISKIISEDR